MSSPSRDFTPSQRFEALAYYFGWQGGTCHQLATATGCEGIVHTAFPEYPDRTRSGGGFSAVRTCDREWRVNRLAPKEQGNVDYWYGVIAGYWATGALGGVDFSSRFGN